MIIFNQYPENKKLISFFFKYNNIKICFCINPVFHFHNIIRDLKSNLSKRISDLYIVI